jgi:anti-anti-sigma regulatory factor
LLKITKIAEDNRSVTLKLEGRIVGRWVNELKKECNKYLDKRSKQILDLSGVTFIDDQGIKMLKAMVGDQVELIRCSLFLSGLLENGHEPTFEVS